MNNSYQTYSLIFSTIYDQPAPISNYCNLHYSILRSSEWLDVERNPLTKAEIHDFAVIWDADHDTRIIKMIEKLYVEGLLSPIQFIGEYKGDVTIILAAKYAFGQDINIVKEYKNAITKIAENVENDHWNCNFGSYDRSGPEHQCDFSDFLGLKHRDSFIYLKNIDMIHQLGTYPFHKKIKI